MTNLEPDVLLGQRGRGVREDVSEALGTVSGHGHPGSNTATYLETLLVLLLLLVDYAKPEVDLICLFKGRRHEHDLRERLLGMLQRSVPVIQDPDPVPELWLLGGPHVSSVPRHYTGENSPLDPAYDKGPAGRPNTPVASRRPSDSSDLCEVSGARHGRR